ncbi:MAG: HdeD family acid-resistance protein [Xanthobacteraceae bacterium]
MSNVQAFEIQIPHDIVQYWGWFLAFGIGLVILGIAAVARAFTATIASMLFFGWLLVIACGIESAQAVMVGHWAGFFHHLLAAILFGVAGLLLVTRPVISAEVATVFMAMFFIVGGLFQLIGSFVVTLPGWGWHALDGVITLALGLMVLAQWPVSGLWAIGLFIGIDLIFYGWAWIALALGLRAS